MLYPKHRPQDCEPYYCAHVMAMTAEGLHSKSDIAVQLAWRDKRIDELKALLSQFANIDAKQSLTLHNTSWYN